MLIAQEALAQYDADKTGKFDYALESAGGSVISTKCTESYNVKSARISVLGIPLWYPSNNPRTIIQVSRRIGQWFIGGCAAGVYLLSIQFSDWCLSNQACH